ncbi:class I SAM-dependent methyltransferase [Segatella baroniae]|uniref:class I SAM-dependent methyltransferase n=1 Tax=Segatella baroniae TaxID=305719 RepID=UPI001EE2C071|nr:class I SAM-dependent methyltransferase [Segatella baroniae]
MPYIARFHAIHCNARVLEIGCGEGGNLLPFARQGCEVWGIDLCEERIRQAQDYFQKQGVDGHFDCVDFLCWPKPAGAKPIYLISYFCMMSLSTCPTSKLLFVAYRCF